MFLMSLFNDVSAHDESLGGVDTKLKVIPQVN